MSEEHKRMTSAKKTSKPSMETEDTEEQVCFSLEYTHDMMITLTFEMKRLILIETSKTKGSDKRRPRSVCA